MKDTKPLILITNDDGYYAKGINELTEIAKQFGDVIVVAPKESQSGMSNAITVKTPIHLNKLSSSNGIIKHYVTGTPVDCVKMALNQVLERSPDLILSGINHGANSSISVVYSGTMGATIEGSLNGIPSIGFSINDFSSDADFSIAHKYAPKIIEQVLKQGLPKYTCLNVNFPNTDVAKSKGIKICRQTKGRWQEEFEKRTDPHKREYYWLTGYFKNFEPDATDTDEWALNNGYISVVPVTIDMTNYKALNLLKDWDL